MDVFTNLVNKAPLQHLYRLFCSILGLLTLGAHVAESHPLDLLASAGTITGAFWLTDWATSAATAFALGAPIWNVSGQVLLFAAAVIVGTSGFADALNVIATPTALIALAAIAQAGGNVAFNIGVWIAVIVLAVTCTNAKEVRRELGGHNRFWTRMLHGVGIALCSLPAAAIAYPPTLLVVVLARGRHEHAG